MKVKILILSNIVLLICISCSISKQQYLSDKESAEVVMNHMYLSKYGYTLKLTLNQAKKNGINPKIYKDFRKSMKIANKDFSISSFADSIIIFFPKERVDTNGLDPKIKIKQPLTNTIIKN